MNMASLFMQHDTFQSLLQLYGHLYFRHSIIICYRQIGRTSNQQQGKGSFQKNLEEKMKMASKDQG